MTVEEVLKLKSEYFDKEGYHFPPIEHRLEAYSSALLYSFIRKYKPTSVLGIGTWEGGSTWLMMAALLKNKKKFNYVASELLDDKRKETTLNCFAKNGKSPIMIGDITKNLDKVPEKIDLLYSDTDHDLDTIKWIVENIFPRLTQGALVVFHDWAVQEINGELVGKGNYGQGGWDETTYLMDLIRENKLPFKKLFWTFKNPGLEETAFWETE